MYDIQLEALPTSSKWKNGLAERHGALLKLMFLKVIHELVLYKESELRYALTMSVRKRRTSYTVSAENLPYKAEMILYRLRWLTRTIKEKFVMAQTVPSWRMRDKSKWSA